MVTILINVILIFGFNHHAGSGTFGKETYSRWPPAYWMMILLSPLHFFLRCYTAPVHRTGCQLGQKHSPWSYHLSAFLLGQLGQLGAPIASSVARDS
jgi:hypothetical protein